MHANILFKSSNSTYSPHSSGNCRWTPSRQNLPKLMPRLVVLLTLTFISLYLGFLKDVAIADQERLRYCPDDCHEAYIDDSNVKGYAITENRSGQAGLSETLKPTFTTLSRLDLAKRSGSDADEEALLAYRNSIASETAVMDSSSTSAIPRQNDNILESRSRPSKSLKRGDFWDAAQAGFHIGFWLGLFFICVGLSCIIIYGGRGYWKDEVYRKYSGGSLPSEQVSSGVVDPFGSDEYHRYVPPLPLMTDSLRPLIPDRATPEYSVNRDSRFMRQGRKLRKVRAYHPHTKHPYERKAYPTDTRPYYNPTEPGSPISPDCQICEKALILINEKITGEKIERGQVVLASELSDDFPRLMYSKNKLMWERRSHQKHRRTGSAPISRQQSIESCHGNRRRRVCTL